jgi:carbon storage regulator CsrA
MLVLSRRNNEKVAFPASNTTAQVVAIKPGVVRLGIEAPPGVVVVRPEVLDRAGATRAGEPEPAACGEANAIRQLCHLIRNRLHSMTIGLALLRRQLQAGPVDHMAATLNRIDGAVQSLQEQLDAARHRAAAPVKLPLHRALLVEDDHNERELLAGFIRMAGLEVATAGVGHCFSAHASHASHSARVWTSGWFLAAASGRA